MAKNLKCYLQKRINKVLNPTINGKKFCPDIYLDEVIIGIEICRKETSKEIYCIVNHVLAKITRFTGKDGFNSMNELHKELLEYRKNLKEIESLGKSRPFKKLKKSVNIPPLGIDKKRK